MVAVQQSAFGGMRCIVLQPNIGTHWRQTLKIFAVLAATTLMVAGIVSLQGFWPVMVFAVLEIWLLAWALYASALRGRQREVVIVRGNQVEVQKGWRGPEQSWVFDTFWTEVALVPSRHRWYPSRLSLRSCGVELELGRFLCEDERVDLARRLERWIGPMAASGEGA